MDSPSLAAPEAVLQELSSFLCGSVKAGERLAPHTSFDVGGPADLWLEPRNLSDLCRSLRVLRQQEWPVTILGNGTNCLISDHGIRGAVICLKRGFSWIEVNGSEVRVGSGVSMPKLSQHVSRLGLTGYEWACGVPGSVGGSVIMNAGAHGGDTAASLEQAQVVREDGEDGWMAASEMQFTYRHSALRDSGAIVTATQFQFEPGDLAAIQDRLAEYRRRRREAQPDKALCAGSVFKNPPGGSAGRLLESLGAKGTRVGGAEVSQKHANFIVNAGGATASDIWALILRLQALALSKAGVRLEPEVIRMGEWEK